MFQYRAYGLIIHSELEIREFQRTERDNADVLIKFGKVPEQLPGNPRTKATFQAVENQFLMYALDTGRFLARNGNEIIIEKFAGASLQQIILFTIGSIFAAILQQRDHLTLHASSILTERGAVLFAGSSGMGKSTLLSSFLKRGYGMISDDVTALHKGEDNIIEAVSAAPVTRLWKDSADELQQEIDKGWIVRDDLEKFNLPVSKFEENSAPVWKIFVLSNSTSGPIAIEEMDQKLAFQFLRKYTYRKIFLHLMRKDEFHFKFITQLMERTSVKSLSFSQSSFELDRLVETVQKEIEGS